jgi:hypothetical protein
MRGPSASSPRRFKGIAVYPKFLLIILPPALMAMASVSDRRSITHNGDGHGAPACVI